MAVFGSTNMHIDNEEVVRQLLADGTAELEQFVYSVPVEMNAVGQTATVQLKISGDPFLVRNIEIYGHTTKGPLFNTTGQTDEPFKVQIAHNNTGKVMFSQEVDISAFCGTTASQTASTFTPSVFNANTELEFRIRHAHQKQYDKVAQSTPVGAEFASYIWRERESILSKIVQGGSTVYDGKVWINIVLKGARIVAKTKI